VARVEALAGLVGADRVDAGQSGATASTDVEV
jgi:hypothetical protein